jgi:hypothetical protein
LALAVVAKRAAGLLEAECERWARSCEVPKQQAGRGKGPAGEVRLPWREKVDIQAAARGRTVGRWVLGAEQGGLLDESAQVSKVDEQVGEGDIGDGSGQAIGPDPLQA